MTAPNQQTQPNHPLEKIGEFHILRKIGEGGLAEIYLAHQRSLNRYVAIKFLKSRLSEDSEAVRRFEREATTLARMSHPNIVHAIARGSENGRLWFAMQYIEGTDFQEILRHSDWPLEKKLDVIIQTLKGLDYAHKNGIIHRDIKPANILIDKEDNALIADFGIAQLLQQPAGDRTETGVVLGTYAYMSPEQREDSTRVDYRTDIYAVGVMLYEALCGCRPEGRFKLPSELSLEYGQAFDRIIEKALASQRRERYERAVDMKDELLAAIHARGLPSGASANASGKIRLPAGSCTCLDTLRRGVYSSTYLVEDNSNRQLYVIKRQSKPDVGLRESRLLSNLVHPNILTVHGAGHDSSKLVLLMEYAQGGSLADRLVKPLEWSEARKLMQQIAAGMDFAHRNNIIHGNLKPSNILFDRNDTVRIADFALMANYEKNAANWYQAPERHKSKSADIYAAGVVFYQLLTNRPPTFDTHGRLVWIDGHRTTSAEQRELVEQMTRTNLSERPGSFAEILRLLTELDAVSSAEAPVEKSSITRQERQLILWGGALLLMVFITLLFLTGIIRF